ncbi:MAG TPA: hypothetical protein PK358_03770 [Spirochaetota bacterium]|nr:hypothetical protein [Spirochaetota bacterium]HPJ33925.1 hypothetical protein [Spirochaetota bacterium]
MTSSSNSILIISEKDNLLPALQEFAAENGIDIKGTETEISLINFLKEKIRETGSLSWIKKDLLDFINSKGHPLMLITDLRFHSGTEHDPDGLKILRTVILSYILITRSESFRDIACNLFILAGHDDYLKFSDEVKEPRLLLNQIKTNDSRINELIRHLKTEQDSFNRNFSIKICDSDSDIRQIKHNLNTFLNMIKTKEKLRIKLKKNEPAETASPEISSAEPADIVFRTGNSYYVNGEENNSYDYQKELRPEEIYVIGNFTSFTRVDVIERLLKLIKSGPSRDYSFRKRPDIIINIPESSVIDITIPVTLAQLLSKELADFRNLKIKTTMKKSKLMQQSRGYNMIQKNIVIYED